jgi:hypothetical protein
MDGGILDVPYKDMDAFFVEYLACLRRGVKLFVVEQKTDVFRFFVDLDWRADEPISDEQLLGIIEKMCGVVPGRCLASRAPVRTEEDGRIKSGVHIHWPETHVTRAKALAFRTRIMLKLDDDPEWNSGIDSSVYGGSGLRMIGSHKMPTGDPVRAVGPGELGTDLTLEDLRDFSIRAKDDKARVDRHRDYRPRATRSVHPKVHPGQERARVKRIGRKGEESLWVQTELEVLCEHRCRAQVEPRLVFHLRRHDMQRCHDRHVQRLCRQQYLFSEHSRRTNQQCCCGPFYFCVFVILLPDV